MKKILTICTMLLISLSLNAQDATTKAKLTKKTTEKSVTVAKKETNKTTAAIKKDAVKEKASIQKSALKSTPKPVAAKTTVTPKIKIRDKAAGTYNGKKLYKGPKGGTYYINSNGNKTYIDKSK